MAYDPQVLNLKFVNALTELCASTNGNCNQDYAAEVFEGIQKIYSQKSRTFHGVRHLGDMMDANSEHLGGYVDETKADRVCDLGIVAGAFHDVVYFSADNSLPGKYSDFMNEYLSYYSYKHLPNNHITEPVVTFDDKQKELFSAVERIFDAENPESPLRQGKGYNEFLSAIIGAHEMQQMGIDDASIVQVATIIHGTVPFKKGEEFNTVFDRLANCFGDEERQLTPAQIDDVKLATCMLANHDVKSFCGGVYPADKPMDLEESLKNVLTGTWELRGEESKIIKVEGRGEGSDRKPTVTEFLSEMKQIRKSYDGFLSKVKGNMFHQVTLSDGRLYPDNEKLQEIKSRTDKLMAGSLMYTDAKLVAAAMVSAWSSQNDCKDKPIGDVLANINRFAKSGRKEDLRAILGGSVDDAVLKVLRYGRDVDGVDFDIPQSPIAAYLFERVAPEAIHRMAEKISSGVQIKPQLFKDANVSAVWGDIRSHLSLESLINESVALTVQTVNSRAM